MVVFDKVDIENYASAENKFIMTHDQMVMFECENANHGKEKEFPDEIYPIRYVVTIVDLRSGLSASGMSWQNNEYCSAFHDGFCPAYDRARKELGLSSIISE